MLAMNLTSGEDRNHCNILFERGGIGSELQAMGEGSLHVDQTEPTSQALGVCFHDKHFSGLLSDRPSVSEVGKKQRWLLSPQSVTVNGTDRGRDRVWERWSELPPKPQPC